MPELNFVATTMAGLEDVLETEIQAHGGENTRKYKRAVAFTGSFALMYKLNFSLRTALRVLWKIRTFRIRTADDYYNGIYRIAWENYLPSGASFAIHPVVNSPLFQNTHFAALRAKDALVDRLRDKTGKRPDVVLKDPDVQINIHVSRSFTDVSLDSSGEPLFKRGYRKDGWEAPLNEVLAAGMLLLAGWEGQQSFLDPMCGSATLAIEAAMIAMGIPPGAFGRKYSFQNWSDYDENLFNMMAESQMKSRDFKHRIIASDISASAVRSAITNVKSARLEDVIEVKHEDFFKSSGEEDDGLIVMNPPYNERIKQYRIDEFYKKIGDHLKSEYKGYTAWILSAAMDALKRIGLKPGEKIPLINGKLECKFQKYELFPGFRNEYLAGKNPK